VKGVDMFNPYEWDSEVWTAVEPINYRKEKVDHIWISKNKRTIYLHRESGIVTSHKPNYEELPYQFLNRLRKRKIC